MYKLDHGGKDKEKLRAAIPSLSELQEHQAGWKDDFDLNRTLRKKFRVRSSRTRSECKALDMMACTQHVFVPQEEKKAICEEEEKDNAVRKRMGLTIPLVPEKDEDKRLASLLTLQSPDCKNQLTTLLHKGLVEVNGAESERTF